MEMGGDEIRNIWKNYFEGPYDIDTQEQVAIHICQMLFKGESSGMTWTGLWIE